MIITDYNKMTLEELEVIHSAIGLEFEIADGKITGTYKED